MKHYIHTNMCMYIIYLMMLYCKYNCISLNVFIKKKKPPIS